MLVFTDVSINNLILWLLHLTISEPLQGAKQEKDSRWDEFIYKDLTIKHIDSAIKLKLWKCIRSLK